MSLAALDKLNAVAVGWRALSPPVESLWVERRRTWPLPPRPSIRSGRATPDILCGCVALFLLVCIAGCGDSPISHTGSSEAISRTTAKETRDPSTDGQKPSANGKSAAADSTTQPTKSVATEEPPAAAAKGRARNISFDTIKFEMEKRARFVKTMLTPTINTLDRKRVKIRGFMFPTSMRAGIARFILVRDNQECCFGPGAALFDAIAVEMRTGETTKYEYFPITVEGVFRIDPIENPLYGEGPLENSHLYVFRMEDALVSKR